MVSVQEIIATINPKKYYKTSDDKEEAKKELKEFMNLIKKEGIQKAAEKAKPNPLSEHVLGYDSSSETLEPIYFYILDLINSFGFETEKIADNFTSSPGSGHFSELGQRATMMQQQGSKILGDINNVLRSILNLIYDLKEFRMRLQHYDSLKSKDANKKDAAVLSLKQIWMDKVDISKGNSSIKAMATTQIGYQTLIDAFLSVKDEKDVNKLDLNDRVKRILLPRIQEFNVWLDESEKELRKRYGLEKNYLRSQVNSLKLYSRWAKPYLKAAKQLEMKEVGREPGLVNVFNTILLELTLLGKSKLNLDNAIFEGKLSSQTAKATKKDFFICIVIDFKFRGIPQRIAQQPHYVFGGKTKVTFSAFTLDENEYEKVKEELDKTDIEDVLNLIKGITEDSLDTLRKDIDFFLEESSETELTKQQKEKPKDTSDPFLALLGRYEKKPSKQGKGIKPDNFTESEYIRPLAEEEAKETLFKFFDIYKKAHGMSSFT